jgi:ABC-type arginine/histidine transport system permease subunit
VIQTAGFVIGIIIAVVCAIGGNWIEAGVVAFIAMFPGTMALVLLHRMRSVSMSDRARSAATLSD